MARPKLGFQLPLRHRGAEKWSFIESPASSPSAVPAWSIEIHAMSGWMDRRSQSADSMHRDRAGRREL